MGRIELAKTGPNSLPVSGLLTRKNRLDRERSHTASKLNTRSPSGVIVGGLAANRRFIRRGSSSEAAATSEKRKRKG